MQAVVKAARFIGCRDKHITQLEAAS